MQVSRTWDLRTPTTPMEYTQERNTYVLMSPSPCTYNYTGISGRGGASMYLMVSNDTNEFLLFFFENEAML
jgi:hypothetical protein